jgi:centromeric protein E
MLGKIDSGFGQKGILEMAAEDIFMHISESQNREFLLRVSFVEIYNENIRDLLSDSADATVAIREDPRKGVYCEASEVIITDFESIIKTLRKGKFHSF